MKTLQIGCKGEQIIWPYVKGFFCFFSMIKKTLHWKTSRTDRKSGFETYFMHIIEDLR